MAQIYFLGRSSLHMMERYDRLRPSTNIQWHQVECIAILGGCKRLVYHQTHLENKGHLRHHSVLPPD